MNKLSWKKNLFSHITFSRLLNESSKLKNDDFIMTIIKKLVYLTLLEAASGIHPEWQGGAFLHNFDWGTKIT